MSKKSTIVGVAAAALVGFVAGVLTAPKSGKETRKDITDKAVDTFEQAKQKSGDVVDYTKDKVSKVKKRFFRRDNS